MIRVRIAGNHGMILRVLFSVSSNSITRNKYYQPMKIMLKCFSFLVTVRESENYKTIDAQLNVERRARQIGKKMYNAEKTVLNSQLLQIKNGITKMETESVIAKNIREKEKENRLSKKNELISELQHARKELSVVANIAKYLENKLSREKNNSQKEKQEITQTHICFPN